MLNPDFKDMLSVFDEEGVEFVLLTSIDGVGFGKAWETRITAEVGGVAVPMLGFADLIRNKEAVGRLRDLADLAELKRTRPE